MNTARSSVLGWTSLFAAAIGGYFIAKSQLASERKEALEKGLRKPPPHVKSWEEIKKEGNIKADQQCTSSQNVGAVPKSGDNSTT